MISSMISPMISTMITSMFSAGLGINIDGKINIVVIGASIMEQSFSDEVDAARSFYTEGGLSVEVFERAQSGDRLADILVDLPGHLAEFAGQEANTIFEVHGGGNNITFSGPYPGGSATIATEYRQVLEDILAAGFYCTAASVTYRVPPGSNPSEPYNTNIINPLIAELLPLWSVAGTPLIDLYQLYFDNQANIDPDGVHPNAALEKITTEYMGQQTGAMVTQTNPPPVSMVDMVCQLGNSGVGALDNSISISGTILNPTNLGGASTLFGSVASDATLRNGQGRGNAGDTTESLTNDDLLKNYLYTDDASVRLISVDTGDVTATYTVKVTASRDVIAADRITDYLIGGVTKQVDAASVTPEIQTWAGVSGQDLLDDGIKWNRATGSAFGYISGIQIIKE